MRRLKFTRDDLEAFSRASHDVNPLHMSVEYARNTSFGTPVVFGMLSGLAALGVLDDGRGRELAEAAFDFRLPIFPDVEYRLEVESVEDANEGKVAILAGPTLHMGASFRFRSPNRRQEVTPTPAPRQWPADWSHDGLAALPAMAGDYGPGPGFATLLTTWGLSGSDPAQVCALLWCSYFVGMEAPGVGAAFSKAHLTFSPPEERESEGALAFEAQVEKLDRRFALVTVGAQLSLGGRPFVRVGLQSFVEQRAPPPSVQPLADRLGSGRPLAGQSALVIGGSRGLGASIAQALALMGCRVFLNFHRSAAHARAVVESLPREAKVELLPGDAADLSWCESARDVVERSAGRLDILVCSASPALQSLAISEETIFRLEEYVTSSLQLVSRPVSTMLPLMRRAGGWLTLISSQTVVTPVPAWPHYVTAKHALEGFARAVIASAPETRALIVRPHRLRTEFANTPMARAGAMAPEIVAARVVLRLGAPSAPGGVYQLDSFESEADRP